MKKRELAYRGVDYVKCFINEHENKNKEFKKLTSLSVNSNQIFIQYGSIELSITSIPGGKYRKLYSIAYDAVSIGFIGLQGGQSPDMIEITGQGLTIFGDDLFYFLFKYFGLTFVKFKRIDLCFDMFLDINYFYENIIDKKYKEKNKDGSWKERVKPWISPKNGLETFEIGLKDVKKNSYSFIRIYNKILDSKNKKKLFLYEDKYKDEDGKRRDVTRFEIELREDLCKKYKFEYLKSYDFQFFRIVKSFYKLNVQFFKFMKDQDFLKFKKKFNKEKKEITQKIKLGIFFGKTQTNSQDKLSRLMEKKKLYEQFGQDFIDEKDKERTITMFLHYGNRLLNNGFSKINMFKMLKKTEKYK